MDRLMKVSLWLNGILFLLLVLLIFLFLPGLALVSVGWGGFVYLVVLLSIPIWGIRVGRHNRYSEDFNAMYKVFWMASWINLLLIFIPFILILL